MNILRFNYDSIDSTNLEARRFWNRADVREQASRALGEGRRLAWVFVAAINVPVTPRNARRDTPPVMIPSLPPLGGQAYSVLSALGDRLTLS